MALKAFSITFERFVRMKLLTYCISNRNIQITEIYFGGNTWFLERGHAKLNKMAEGKKNNVENNGKTNRQ